jgi:ribosome biogenesis GTPase
MREFGLWDADEGVDGTFAEIVEIASHCRFADCSHKFEPGCAVRTAVADGRLDAGRLKSYRRLSHELAEQPSTAQRRERDRRFQKAVRSASADSMARKRFDGWG